MVQASGFLARAASLLVLLPILGSCTSFGEGVTRAVLRTAEERALEGDALCEVTGPPFQGLAGGLNGGSSADPRTVRLIIVHGIGEKVLGHAQRLVENLALRLGLGTVDPTTKVIGLRSPADSRVSPPGVNLGTLRITRYGNGADAQLLAFEVTWSELFAIDRKALLFDAYGLHAKARADINESLKKLINSFTEPLAYHGPKGALARASVLQAICWSARSEWADYPEKVEEACSLRDARSSIITRDTFAIASHSLGSRIAIDAVMELNAVRQSYAADAAARPGFEALQLLRDKEIALFMLANQLPLLQVGQPVP